MSRHLAKLKREFADGIGPYDVFSEIIANSQHGRSNSGLFGIRHSPTRQLHRFGEPSSSRPLDLAEHLSQDMQNIGDGPLPTIQNDVHFHRNSERRNSMARNADASIPSISTANTPSTNIPPTILTNIPSLNTEIDKSKITMKDLFGEEKRADDMQQVNNMIGEVGGITPLLTPPRQPPNSDSPSLPVLLDLGALDAPHLERLRKKYRYAVSFKLVA
ncbi:unnamed protein product [Gongylonema pulchrum]|uniref:Autophagy-related protein 13 n=1 Tax=Gongylonema pulchrum TaxID=637853 RepID=A0A183DP06_9BILA|nr:unnamed protein product [Gongylonema pulchrum]